MLSYMAGVTQQDARSSSEVAEMCGVKDLSVELRKRRLRWFGHMRRVAGRVLNEVEEVRVGGRQLVRWPKKRWRECVTGYEFVVNRRTYGTRSPVVESIHCLSNPTLKGKMQTLNENDDDDDNDVFYCSFQSTSFLCISYSYYPTQSYINTVEP
ncbi:hypothetical protein E2C01_043531 [Portunus trituberculatus]|uniref:Uncharacterized protein n=1 Tax=Portunus trituberculatus TaxID=210409 RepID=A0A5B7FWY8_PORTR|nr:hypothetical protein [Portunus trituberculatus]